MSAVLRVLPRTLASRTNARLTRVQVLAEIDAVHMRNRLPLFASDRYQPDWGNEGEIGEPVP